MRIFYKKGFIEVYTPEAKRVYQVVAAYTMPAESILDKWNGCKEPIDMFNYIQEIKFCDGIYNDDAVLNNMREHTYLISKPNSTENICKIIMS